MTVPLGALEEGILRLRMTALWSAQNDGVLRFRDDGVEVGAVV
jgi:hypothetical protein